MQRTQVLSIADRISKQAPSPSLGSVEILDLSQICAVILAILYLFAIKATVYIKKC